MLTNKVKPQYQFRVAMPLPDYCFGSNLDRNTWGEFSKPRDV